MDMQHRDLKPMRWLAHLPLAALRGQPLETFDFHNPAAVTAQWMRENFEALAEEGVIARSDLDLLHFVETAEEGWAIVKSHYQL